MLTGQNIIFFANDWDADPTSKHQVTKVLVQNNRVLWVNSIGLRRPEVSNQDLSRIVKKVRQFWKGPVTINRNLYVITPLFLPFHGSRLVRKINAWFVSRYVRSHAKKLGMQKFQMWVILPSAAAMIPYLKPQKVVYYCVDEWSAFSFLDGKVMREMEESLLAQSDLVLVSAGALYTNKSLLNPHTYLVPHGVDSEHFGRARDPETEIPQELKALSRPIIGFWGLIHEWIDLELLRYLANAHPDWSVVLVGKVNTDCAVLRRIPNIHFLGPRPYSSLPGFAKGFTAAMLPFKINRLTESVNPIKLREYLAAGLPVVSTALPEAKPYAGIVRIASTHEKFVREMEAAVNDTSAMAALARMESVAKDTWRARVEYISSLVAGSDSLSSATVPDTQLSGKI
jgi:glycosyltransferase involved in cell wall biosynthesis